jgi:hypothetical protein
MINNGRLNMTYPMTKLARAGLFTLLLASGLAACKDSAVEPAVVEPIVGNTLLPHVPADTAYAFGNLQPVPVEVTDAYLARLQPIMDAFQNHISEMRTDIEASQEQDQESRIVLALLDEFDGNLNRAGLESLGFSLESHKVLYGHGAFPVIRMGLLDADALRAAIARIEERAGMTLPVLELDGTAYWRLSDDGEAGIYIAILDDQLAISAFPASAEPELLPSLLGHSLPPNSMATDNRLAKLSGERGHSGYGSGFIDIRKMASEFLDADSLTAGYLGAANGFDPTTFDAVCVQEIKGIVNQAPLMVAGNTGLTVNRIDMRYELDIEPTLAGRLAALVSDVPVADNTPGRLMSAALALRFGAVRDLLLEKVAAIVEQPFQCEYLMHINNNATQLYTELNRPMPPLVGNLMGARVALDDIQMNDGQADNVRGFLALHVVQPQMFVGMAQMFVPDLSELELTPGDDPVRLPPGLVPNTSLPVFAALSDDAIGLSAGEGYETELPAFLAVDKSNDGVFFSIGYDMARFMEMQTQLTSHPHSDQVADTVDDNASNGKDNPVHSVDDNHKALSKAFRDSYAAMLGNTRLEVRFTAAGLVADNQMNFQ